MKKSNTENKEGIQMNLEEYNNKFYEDTYYDIDVRLFIQTYHHIHNLRGKLISEQLKLKEHYKTLNEYERLYLDLIQVCDKYCEHFVTLPVQNKHKVGLPIFLQLKEEYKKTGIQQMLSETKFIDNYPYLLVDFIYKQDNSYPEELLPLVNSQFLLKQINQHYMQEIFDTNDKYFTPEGNLNLDVIDIITYTEEHTELLREDYE